MGAAPHNLCVYIYIYITHIRALQKLRRGRGRKIPYDNVFGRAGRRKFVLSGTSKMQCLPTQRADSRAAYKIKITRFDVMRLGRGPKKSDARDFSVSGPQKPISTRAKIRKTHCHSLRLYYRAHLVRIHIYHAKIASYENDIIRHS